MFLSSRGMSAPLSASPITSSLCAWVCMIAPAPHRKISCASEFVSAPDAFVPPLSMMVFSSSALRCATTRIFSSTLDLVMSRRTTTGRDCPILCALASACMSRWGLKSVSYRMTVSADARLMPCPPARVESRNTNTVPSLSLNWSMRRWRSLPGTFPSIRTYVYLRKVRNFSRMLSIVVNCEKIRTLEPFWNSFGRICWRKMSFPEAPVRSTCSASLEGAGGMAESKRYAWLQHLRSSISTLRRETRRSSLFAPLRIRKLRVRHAA
mmetsp:Transcript_30860/g.73328  ORF Transcript_30860/g.73328 Transcript_30860/m.73328 type:complete len:266 (-) Transcript_30860:3154-3951(-)